MTTFYRKLEDMKVEHPEGFSPLQELYPGRLMPVTEVYDRYSFQNQYPTAAKESFEENKVNTQEYGRWLEKTARAASPASEKMTVHQVEDPSSFIEEPDLKDAQIQQPPTYGDAMDVKYTPIDEKKDDKIEHFGITGTKQDRLFIAIFGLLAILVIIKMNQ